MYPESYSTLSRCEYRIKPWKKALSIILGFPFIVGGLVLATTSRLNPDKIATAIPALLLLAVGVYLLSSAYRSRLILDGTRIEVRTAFGERSADRADIEGYRTISTRSGTLTKLQLKGGERAITVSNDFETDGEYSEWMRKVPDLDKSDRESMLDEIKQQQNLGSTPEERLGKLANAKTFAIFAAVVTVALALVTSFAGPPLQLPAELILVAAPIFIYLLMQQRPLLYTIFKRKADPRADLGFVLMAAGFGFLLVNHDIHLVSIWSLLPEMAVLAALFLVPLLAAKQDNALMNRAISLLIFAAFYAYGVAVAADAQLDTTAPVPFRATVVRMHEYHGRSTTYALYLAPWGPLATTNRLNVSSRFYHRTEIGDAVCLDLHPGTLHAQWFTQVDCGLQSGSAPPQ